MQLGKLRFLAYSCLAVAMCAAAVQADGIDTNDPSLPPLGPPAVYLSPDDVHALYNTPAFAVLLERPEHYAIACREQPGSTGVVRTNFGPDEQEEFCSDMRGDVTIAALGLNDVPVTSTGPVRTMVFGKVGNTTGVFDTEMLALNLVGTTPAPFMIRESPTLRSTGKTTITDIGGGMYHIDSFFDVFTELSIDGGVTWTPDSGGSVRMTLAPEPSSFALIAMGLAGAAGMWWRKRRAA
jgi:PEP-CTERM motif